VYLESTMEAVPFYEKREFKQRSISRRVHILPSVNPKGYDGVWARLMHGFHTPHVR
jgi:hypothetical protein